MYKRQTLYVDPDVNDAQTWETALSTDGAAVNYEATAPTSLGTALSSTLVANGFFNGAIGYVGMYDQRVAAYDVARQVTRELPLAQFLMREGGGDIITSPPVPLDCTPPACTRDQVRGIIKNGASWHKVTGLTTLATCKPPCI